MRRAWVPSALERKCLAHLDREENWRLLRQERPDERKPQPWAPFRRIFAINLVQYALVLAVVLFGLESAAGVALSDIHEDFPIGLGVVAALSGAMALYTAHLYRRSWNHRASSPSLVEGVPASDGDEAR